MSSSSQTQITLLIIFVCFPLFFAALWSAIMFMASQLGGWGQLGKSFPTPSRPQGKTFGMASISLGWANYNNCVIAVVANEGLYLQLWFPFRVFHPALLVPWTAFSPFTEEKFLFITRYATTLSLRNGGTAKLYINKADLFQAVQAKLAEAASGPDTSAWANSTRQF